MTGILEYLLGPGTGWHELAVAVVDIALVAYLVYRVLLLIRGTRAIQVLLGLFVLGLGYLGSQWAGLMTLNWLLGHFLTYSFIFGVIVIFQADIRRALAQLGRGRIASLFARDDRVEQRGTVEAVVRAASELSRRHHGALVVLERVAELSELAESGVRLDAAAGSELLLALFHPGGPMHDGAVIIRGGRIVAARCVLPLSTAPAGQELGTRHRAALGLAEEVDAAVVVISEERGEISLAVTGKLHRGLDSKRLREMLQALFLVPDRGGRAGPLARLWRARERTATPEGAATAPRAGKETHGAT